MMIKTCCLAVYLMLLPLAASAIDVSRSALEAINHLGGISISDGSSYFTFFKDGRFASEPVGASGRTMHGQWVIGSSGRLIATANFSWLNGVSTGDDYRKIVFVIASTSLPAVEAKPQRGPPATLVDAYFYIDEMVNMPKPNATRVAQTSTPARATATSFKGIELYSWKMPSSGQWSFTLLPGTNRNKRCEEISDPRQAIHAIAVLKERIAHLAPGESVFWMTPKCKGLSMPPDNTRDDIIEYAATVQVKISI